MTFETQVTTLLIIGGVTGVIASGSTLGMYLASEDDNFYLFRGQTVFGLFLSLVSALSISIFLHQAWRMPDYQVWLPGIIVTILILISLAIANAIAFMKSG